MYLFTSTRPCAESPAGSAPLNKGDKGGISFQPFDSDADTDQETDNSILQLKHGKGKLLYLLKN